VIAYSITAIASQTKGVPQPKVCGHCGEGGATIVVLLRSSVTRVGEIEAQLGYDNKSPVSKALTGIKQKAVRHSEFD
jgi:hypothetical protein